MFPACNGPGYINAAFAVVHQMRAGIIDDQIPAVGIFKGAYVLMSQLPHQSVKVSDGAGRGDFNGNVIAA